MILKVLTKFCFDYISYVHIARRQVIESRRGAKFLLFFKKYNVVPLLTPNIIPQYAQVRIFFSYTFASSFKFYPNYSCTLTIIAVYLCFTVKKMNNTEQNIKYGAISVRLCYTYHYLLGTIPTSIHDTNRRLCLAYFD